MKALFCFRLISSALPFLGLLAGGNVVQAQSVPFAVSFWYPTNGQSYIAPATVGLHARVIDSNVVETVQYFSGPTRIGTVSNISNVLLTNSTQENPFYLAWSNVTAGTYTVTAVATDNAGLTATSAPVTFTVANPPPPKPSAYIYSPTNNSKYLAPASLTIYARAVESGGTVATVTFVANDTILGVVSNSSETVYTNISTEPLFVLPWPDVPAGSYALRAIATDLSGNSTTSSVVNISVTNLPPPPKPAVYIYSPTNNSKYYTPANLTLYARAVESGVTVATVTFVASGTILGVVSNSSEAVYTNISSEPLFALPWPDVPTGNYALTAIATDLSGNSATSTVVNITVTNPPPPPPPVPFTISFWYPTNGQTYTAPATVGLHARVMDSNVVETVQYFSGTTSLGTVSNLSSVLLTSSTQDNPFYLGWSNVTAGTYILTAVATDSAGLTVTSAPVTITVTNPPPPKPSVYIYSPSNNSKYLAPANLTIYARAVESGGTVATVTFVANDAVLGVVSNSSEAVYTNISTEPLFALPWADVTTGSYALRAIATDLSGNSATSTVVNITVTNPPPPVPFTVSFYYPTNGEFFLAPANIGVHALALDSNVIETVQYFSGTTSIGTVSNASNILLTSPSQSNPFFLSWSNVPAGEYTMTAVATDSAGLMATSAPVNIFVVTSLPPVIRIYAPDPVAVEGTNCGPWFTPATSFTNYCSGSNTATFLVQRDGATNTDLTVYYTIGGTASNGVDYAAISDNVTIPAGKTYALITISPLNDDDATNTFYDTVILSLLAPTNEPPAYRVGSPQKAGAIILEENLLPMPNPVVRYLIDGSLHLSLPANAGVNFCLQSSPDLVNWQPVCTNTVLKGSAQYVAPDASASSQLFYRIVLSDSPPSY